MSDLFAFSALYKFLIFKTSKLPNSNYVSAPKSKLVSKVTFAFDFLHVIHGTQPICHNIDTLAAYKELVNRSLSRRSSGSSQSTCTSSLLVTISCERLLCEKPELNLISRPPVVRPMSPLFSNYLRPSPIFLPSNLFTYKAVLRCGIHVRRDTL